jgi:hypothetical protein
MSLQAGRTNKFLPVVGANKAIVGRGQLGGCFLGCLSIYCQLYSPSPDPRGIIPWLVDNQNNITQFGIMRIGIQNFDHFVWTSMVIVHKLKMLPAHYSRQHHNLDKLFVLILRLSGQFKQFRIRLYFLLVSQNHALFKIQNIAGLF